MNTQDTPGGAPSALLGDLATKHKTLKPLYDEHSKAIAVIREDNRYSSDYQRELISKAEDDFEGKMDDAISGFANAVEMKKAALHALAAPSVEEKGAKAQPPPKFLTLASDRALWQSTMENQSLLAEVVKNQQIGFHREDISMMSAAEIISTYRDEGTDEVFRNSLELFGSRHLQRLAKGGDRVAAEAFQQFKAMAEARRENAKTLKQKQEGIETTFSCVLSRQVG